MPATVSDITRSVKAVGAQDPVHTQVWAVWTHASLVHLRGSAEPRQELVKAVLIHNKYDHHTADGDTNQGSKFL